jgi:hypothetical protein
MTEVRHIAERDVVPRLVLTRVKTFPITRKLAALGRELCSPRPAVDRVCFLPVSAAVVIEHEVCIGLQAACNGFVTSKSHSFYTF